MRTAWWRERQYHEPESPEALELQDWFTDSRYFDHRNASYSSLVEFDGVWSYLFRMPSGRCWLVHWLDTGTPELPEPYRSDDVVLACLLAPDRWAALEANELPLRSAIDEARGHWLVVQSPSELLIETTRLDELPNCLPEPGVLARPR